MLLQDLVLKHDELYLVGESQAEGSGERASGLYARDTRFLNHWDLRLNDQPLEPLVAHVLGSDRALIIGANSALPAAGDAIAEPVRPLTISVEQHVQLTASLHVRIAFTNYSGRALPLGPSLEFAADFRDLFDIRGFPRRRRGGTFRPPLLHDSEVVLGFEDRTGTVTSLCVMFSQLPTPVVTTTATPELAHEPAVLLPGFDQISDVPALPPPPRVRVQFETLLQHGERWEVEVALTPIPAGELPISSAERPFPDGQRRPISRISTDHDPTNRTLKQAAADLAMLQTTFRDGALSAAGVPWFVAPFGRDSLIVALQTLHLAQAGAVATLRMLARLQGRAVDPFREEEPGKILHEMRYGEMARLGEVPHAPYFGSVDSTPLFVMLFAETVRWTGDESLYRELLPHVNWALEWIEHWGDRDGDGLVEYHAEPAGLGRIVHQGWKDSHDSLHSPDGVPVLGNIALVEVQGYVYAAYRWLSDVAAHFGDAAWAAELQERAERIRQLVEDCFWLPDQGYYAQALDAEKRPVAAISSNPGHLLYCGLPSPERARLVSRRMLESDLDSEWGIRTLSSALTTYNPMSYHNGSVWPHDNSLIAAGLGRYHDQDRLAHVASAIFSAAERLPDQRLPELYCGFARDNTAAACGPVPYPVSCRPQAWAAGSPALLIRSLLGLETDLEQRALRVSPAFPAWLNHVRLSGLEALGQRFDLDVRRDGLEYRCEVDGSIRIIPSERRDSIAS